jgi:peptidyl-prolyl cis-trans isomerase A (cyclophilin A)
MSFVYKRREILAAAGGLLLAGCSSPEESVKEETAPSVFRVNFDTSVGGFIVEVHREWAPIGADRFFTLVKHKFFDNSRFFRVIPGFMVQFGLAADPKENKKWMKLSDDPVTQSNKPGYISFATAGPFTRTTQVFINYGDNARLDASGFSPFGRVVSGTEVVEKIYSGYGEGAPNGNGPAQPLIEGEGNAYLEREFPKLDYIKTARIAG